MLADVGDDLPVLVKTAEGWKHVTIAYEEILWTEKTPPGIETEAFFLELLPTVEELDPYFTKENREEVWWEVLKRDEADGALFVAIFNTEEHPNAKAAAEAECARLNAEYRKEKNNV